MGTVLSVPLEDEFKDSLARKDLSAAAALLQQNRKLVDVKLSRATGDKAFHAAARAGDAEGLLRMVDAVQTSILNLGHPAGHAHSHKADGPGTMQDAQKKVAKAVNQVNARGQTPLMLACEQGNVPVVTALLNAGADPWLGDDLVMRTCLHYAAGTGKDRTILAVIAHVRSHPAIRASQHAPACLYEVHDIPAASGLTPLHYAAWRRQIAAVVALTKEGANLYARSGQAGMDPDCPNCNEGSTPLHLAALKGSHGTVKTLLKAYVLRTSDDDAQQQQQQQQQQEAAPPQASEASMPSQQPPPQQQAVHPHEPERGVDPRTVTDGHGNTPFSVARTAGHYHILSELNPLTPLAHVLAQDNPDDRALGVPRLQELAAKVAHSILMKQIAELAQLIKDSKQHELPPTSLYAAAAKPQPPLPRTSKSASHAAGMARASSGRRSREPSAHRSSGGARGLARAPSGPALRSQEPSAHRGGGGGSAHGAVLLGAASLLAGMATHAGPGQPVARQQSLHRAGGSAHAGAWERPSLPGQRSVHGLRADGPAAGSSLSGAFSLRSAAALTAQLRQECSRHMELPAGQGGGAEGSRHLQQLQEMQGWDSQELEETSHMARTHRLLRGVGAVDDGGDGQQSPLALVAVVPSAGVTPASAILIDGRTSRAAGEAGATFSAAAAGAAVAALSRSSSQPQPSLHGVDDPGAAAAAPAAGRAYPVFSPPRDGSLLAAVDEDEATPGPAPGAAAAAASTPSRRARGPAAAAGQSPFSDPAAGDGPLVNLFSLSRQSSQALGHVSVGLDEAAGTAAGSALVRLASFARQASQPLKSRQSTRAAGLDDEERRAAPALGHDSLQPAAGRRGPAEPDTSVVGPSGADAGRPAADAGRPGVSVPEAGPAAGTGSGAPGPAAGGDGLGPDWDSVLPLRGEEPKQTPPQQLQQAHVDGMSDDDGEVCGVCLDSGDFVELRQCGHMLCVDCATELIRLHEYKAALCPLCRGMICGFRQPAAAQI